MEKQPQFPAEEVTLPSKGLLYSEDSPLRSGKIEMKYMTAKEEDILTNQNYIRNGTAIDRLLKSLIATPGVNFKDLLLGDKNAIMLAARILGYGAEYEVKRTHPETGIETEGVIDLSKVKDKLIDENIIIDGKNEFEFILPTSKIKLTFKLLTQGDDKTIEREIAGLKKIKKQVSENILRFKHMILSLDGDYDTKKVRDFVEDKLLARDARPLRNHITNIQPGIDMFTEVEFKDGYIESGVMLPININFFWPDAEL